MTEENELIRNDDLNENDEYFEEDELIKSPLKRVLMVLFSPQLVYKSLSVKSSKFDWIIPLVLSILISLILINIGKDYIRNDQIESTVKRIERTTGLTEEEKAARIEQMKQTMERMAGFQHVMANVSSVVGVFIWLLLVALVMMAVTHWVLNEKLAFNDAFKIGALGSVVTLVGSLAKLPVILYLESFAQAKISLGTIFPEGLENNFLVKLFDIDIFMLWFIIIISIGISVFAKKSLSRALIPMLIIWFVFRIVTISIIGAIGGLGA